MIKLELPSNFQLIVHIGAGKAGSTSIQANLAANEAWLDEQKTAYFGLLMERVSEKLYPWQKNTTLNNLAGLKNEQRLQAQEEIRQTLLKTIKKIAKQGYQRAIWSNETLLETSDFIIPILKDLIGAGIDVHIIAYIRRHDAWLQSAYLQWGIKHKTYNGPLQPFNVWRQNHLPNFSSKLEPWLTEKSWADISVRNFDAYEDVAKDFFSYNQLYDPTLKLKRANKTPNDACLALWALYNGQFDGKVSPRELQPLLTKSGVFNSPIHDYELAELLPDQREIDAIQIACADDRQRMDAIFSRFSQPPMLTGKISVKQESVSQNQINAMLLLIIKKQADDLQRLENQLKALSQKVNSN